MMGTDDFEPISSLATKECCIGSDACTDDDGDEDTMLPLPDGSGYICEGCLQASQRNFLAAMDLFDAFDRSIDPKAPRA